MSTPRRPTEAESEATADVEESEDTPTLNARDVDGDRTVFTEQGNSDGWISTDLTVVPSE